MSYESQRMLGRLAFYPHQHQSAKLKLWNSLRGTSRLRTHKNREKEPEESELNKKHDFRVAERDGQILARAGE
jgi:hypothetical protein